jgi:hypothetical protein
VLGNKGADYSGSTIVSNVTANHQTLRTQNHDDLASPSISHATTLGTTSANIFNEDTSSLLSSGKLVLFPETLRAILLPSISQTNSVSSS